MRVDTKDDYEALSPWQSFTLPHDSRLKHIAFQPNSGSGSDFLHIQLFAGLPNGNNSVCEFYLDWWPATVIWRIAISLDFQAKQVLT